MPTSTSIDYRPNTAAAQQTITVGATAATLTSLLSTALAADTDYVILSVETDQVRICPTGTVPTASLGLLLSVGTILGLSRAEADVANVIRVTTSATVQVIQYTKV